MSWIWGGILGVVLGGLISHVFLKRKNTQQLQEQVEQTRKQMALLEQEHQDRLRETTQSIQDNHKQHLQRETAQLETNYQSKLQEATQAMQAEYEQKLQQAREQLEQGYQTRLASVSQATPIQDEPQSGLTSASAFGLDAQDQDLPTGTPQSSLDLFPDLEPLTPSQPEALLNLETGIQPESATLADLDLNTESTALPNLDLDCELAAETPVNVDLAPGSADSLPNLEFDPTSIAALPDPKVATELDLDLNPEPTVNSLLDLGIESAAEPQVASELDLGLNPEPSPGPSADLEFETEPIREIARDSSDFDSNLEIQPPLTRDAQANLLVFEDEEPTELKGRSSVVSTQVEASPSALPSVGNQVEPVRSILQILRSVYHPSSEIREIAAATLGEIAQRKQLRADQRQATAILGKLSQDPLPQVRQQAVRALGFIASEQCLPYLKHALRDTSPEVVQAAAIAVRNCKPKQGRGQKARKAESRRKS
jgi:hypothetical protein